MLENAISCGDVIDCVCMRKWLRGALLTSFINLRFPRDEDLRKQWIANLRRKNSRQPNTNSVLCSKHFESHLLDTSIFRTVLQRGAIPTLFENTLLDIPRSSVALSPDLAWSNLPESKVIIGNVYRYLQDEYEKLKSFTANSVDLSPLEDILKRTSEATGVSEEIITEILVERKRSDNFLRLDAIQSKRKRSYELKADDASPIEEDSDSEGSDKDTHADTGIQTEREYNKQAVNDETEIASVKMELEIQDWDPLEVIEDVENKEAEDPLYEETSSAVQNLQTTYECSEVKVEDDAAGYSQFSPLLHNEPPDATLGCVKNEFAEDEDQILELYPVQYYEIGQCEGDPGIEPSDGGR